jgi:hypothetical protein
VSQNGTSRLPAGMRIFGQTGVFAADFLVSAALNAPFNPS